MKYVIMAAGNGTRWNNYLGVPKHLIEIKRIKSLRKGIELTQRCANFLATRC